MKDASLFELQSVPCQVLISMENQEERRRNAMRQFAGLGLNVEWKVPIKIADIQWDKLPAAYREHPKYASQTLTILDVLDEVESKGAESFALFEDDIVFHPHTLLLLPQIVVPEDWKFFYIGGRNNGSKQYVSKGLVKSTFVSDLHAVVINSEIIHLLRRVLVDGSMNTHWADARIASLHKKYPAYLCRPNLAWQSFHADESGAGVGYSNYYADGSVKPGQGD